MHDDAKDLKKIIHSLDSPPESVKTPELDLLWAILSQATVDYTTPLGIKSTTSDTQDLWMMEATASWVHDPSNDPFTFNWVCEHLDIDAKLWRDALVALRDAKKRLKLPTRRKGKRSLTIVQDSSRR